jgi:hypothetical protein
LELFFFNFKFEDMVISRLPEGALYPWLLHLTLYFHFEEMERPGAEPEETWNE